MYLGNHEKQRVSRWGWISLFVLAAVLWGVDFNRPADLPGWHELDYSTIARNFVREGNDIRYPRIDWRGDGPGFTEMEFPAIPWIMAQSYRLFGTHEQSGRILALVCTLLSLLIFMKLARKVLPNKAAWVAMLFFVFGHEVMVVASAIQPEALMMLLYLMAAYYFLDWYEKQSWTSYGLAIGAFAGAMLIKLPAAHLAIFFFVWALIQDGRRAFRRPSLYVFALLSFAPAMLWYAHAAGLWHEFHKSMGVSNEDHWLGLDLIRRPKVVANFLLVHAVLVFGAGGVLAALALVARDRLRTEVNRLALAWYMAVAIYLVVILRTSSGYWAAYYHVVAVPPAALLFGGAVNAAAGQNWRKFMLPAGLWLILTGAALDWLGSRDVTNLPGVLQDLAAGAPSGAVLLVLCVFSLTVTVLCLRSKKEAGTVAVSGWMPRLVATGCALYFLVSGVLLIGTWRRYEVRTPQYLAAENFRTKLLPQTLIVASGGLCQDQSGHKVANDNPGMFYWLDRKGFTTCEGKQSVAELLEYARRGASYFVADRATLDEQPGLENELRHTFPLLAEDKTALLFSLPSKQSHVTARSSRAVDKALN